MPAAHGAGATVRSGGAVRKRATFMRKPDCLLLAMGAVTLAWPDAD
jgi:hypothetical protein